MTPRICFLDVEFDPLPAETAAAAIARRAHGMGPFAYVTAPNVEHMVRLDRQPDLMRVYDDAWMTLCDSRIIEAFANASYIDLPATSGADVVEDLFRRHIASDDRVLMIGGTGEMAVNLRRKFGLKDLRWFNPPGEELDDAAMRAASVRFIRENPATYVFIAIGSPQQEMIANEARQSGDCSGTAICCGTSLEFLAGVTWRAPRLMRESRLDWMFRLCTEPGQTLKRYLVDSPRLFMIWHRWRTRIVNASAISDGMAVSSH